MANGENSSNTAIVALIIIGLVVAAAAFFYYQGGFGAPDVVERETTIIEKQVPAPEPAPVPEPKEEDEPGFKLEHEDDEGNKTEIQTP